MTRWLVLLDRPVDATAEEGLRIAVGALAAGAAVQLVLSRAAVASIARDEIDEAGEEYLHTLQQAGGPYLLWDAADFEELLTGCDHVLRVGASDRIGTPLLCTIDRTWLTETPASDMSSHLRNAGQVMRQK